LIALPINLRAEIETDLLRAEVAAHTAHSRGAEGLRDQRNRAAASAQGVFHSVDCRSHQRRVSEFDIAT